MRLNEITKKTGLTKKAIHFYIEEDLINPIKNDDNGYYDFDQNDLIRLNQISLFRKTGLSIQTIKDCFQYPTLLNFFLHRQVNIIKQNVLYELNTLSKLEYIINNAPPNLTPNDLIDTELKESNVDHVIIDQLFSINDSRMVAILVWTPFLNMKVDEYRKFLWDKISNELRLQFDYNLVYIMRLIYQLTPKQISDSSIKVYKLYQEFKNTNEQNLPFIAETLLKKIISFCDNRTLVDKWLLLKKPVLEPVMSLYHSSSSTLLKEYNPDFVICSQKLNIICKLTIEIINQDPKTKELLNHRLNINFDNLDDDMNELIFIMYFEDSIYNCLTIDELQEYVFKND